MERIYAYIGIIVIALIIGLFISAILEALTETYLGYKLYKKQVQKYIDRGYSEDVAQIKAQQLAEEGRRIIAEYLEKQLEYDEVEYEKTAKEIEALFKEEE